MQLCKTYITLPAESGRVIYVIMYDRVSVLKCGNVLLCNCTVQITFIFIGQTHLVFGKRVCTCVTKHSNAFRTFLNWLKNSKRVWHVWHVWHV